MGTKNGVHYYKVHPITFEQKDLNCCYYYTLLLLPQLCIWNLSRKEMA